jgi:hypothetical protein
MHAHARLGAFVEGEEEDVCFAGADGGDHAFGEAELHLAGLQVGDHDDPRARRAWIYTAAGSHDVRDGLLRTDNPEIAVPLAEIFAEL